MLTKVRLQSRHESIVDKKIEFIDLKAQQSLIRDKINERVNRVLNHGKYIMGQKFRSLKKLSKIMLEPNTA